MRYKKLKQELANMFKKLVAENLIQGEMVNLSIRTKRGIIINKMGKMSMAENYILVDIKGKPCECTKIQPSLLVSIHCKIYKIRQDVNAVLLCRGGAYTEIMANISQKFPITPEVSFLFGSPLTIIKIDKLKAKDVDEFIVKQKNIISKNLKTCNGVIIPFLGVGIVGKDLEEIYYRIKALENIAKTIVFTKLFSLGRSNLRIPINIPLWLDNLLKKEGKISLEGG